MARHETYDKLGELVKAAEAVNRASRDRAGIDTVRKLGEVVNRLEREIMDMEDSFFALTEVGANLGGRLIAGVTVFFYDKSKAGDYTIIVRYGDEEEQEQEQVSADEVQVEIPVSFQELSQISRALALAWSCNYKDEQEIKQASAVVDQFLERLGYVRSASRYGVA